MSPELARNLFVLVAVFVLGWFAIGTQLNIRKGNHVLRWLQDGLGLVGEKTTLRWLGSSAVELKVQKALGAFRTVEVFVVLEPRDIPFLLWFFRARGRHDLLIIRGQLRAMPRFELEALDTRAWSTRGIEGTVQRKNWIPVGTPPGSSLVAYVQGRVDAASELLALATRSDLPLVRLAIHQNAPHLEAQWRLAGFERLASRRLLEALCHLAERL